MKKLIPALAVILLCAACEQRVEPGAPAEKNTTIVNPPATEKNTTIEKNTTNVVPPSTESSTSTTTTTKP